MLIDITIPVLNEEETLEANVRKADAFIQSNLSDLGTLRIVIADNGSTDRTPEIARRLAEEMTGVAFVQVDRRGVGLALKTSWGQSPADIVGYMDLDLATDLSHLREALGPLVANAADLAAGSRLKKGARVVGRTPLRAVTSRAFNMIVQTYVGVKFTDGMCGFKFLQRRHLDALMEAGAVSDGWFFSTELLVCAEHLGLRILDLPVTWTDDSDSRVKILKLTREYLAAMHRLKTRLQAKQA